MTSRDEALRALEKELRDESEAEQLKSQDKNWSEWVRDRAHGRSSGLHHAANQIQKLLSARQEVAPVAYFAADPANGEFDRYESLEEARERAEQFLDFADDDAADSGWADDPPQICYGVIVGHCVEESRKPAPTGSEFTEVVNFRLEESTSPAQTSEARDADLIEAIRVAFKAMNRSYHEDRRVMFHELQPMFDISCKYQFRLVPVEEDAAMRQEAGDA